MPREKVLSLIASLDAHSNGLSLANATHARAIRVLTYFSVEPTCELRYLKSSYTASSCRSRTSFVIETSFWASFSISKFEK